MSPIPGFSLSVNAPDDDRPPMAIAAQWVSQITGIALECVVPVVVGRWLDQRWGTSYWTVVGAVLGPVLGFWHLLTLTGIVAGTHKKPDDKNPRP